MKTIYTGGMIPELAICDDPNSSHHGWLMVKNYDGRFVSLADLKPHLDESLQAENERLRRELAAEEAACHQLIGDRDMAAGWADTLAYAAGSYFGVDIGEHSNTNNPWSNAYEAIPEQPPAGKSSEARAGDQCDKCKREYLAVYNVPTDIWAQIAPRPETLGPDNYGGGMLCPDCAASAAKAMGIRLIFVAERWHEGAEDHQQIREGE